MNGRPVVCSGRRPVTYCFFLGRVHGWLGLLRPVASYPAVCRGRRRRRAPLGSFGGHYGSIRVQLKGAARLIVRGCRRGAMTLFDRLGAWILSERRSRQCGVNWGRRLARTLGWAANRTHWNVHAGSDVASVAPVGLTPWYEHAQRGLPYKSYCPLHDTTKISRR